MNEFRGRMSCTPRIRQLEYASGSRLAVIVRFVQRDGLDAVDLSILENAQADAGFADGSMVAHADVMHDVLHVVRQAR